MRRFIAYPVKASSDATSPYNKEFQMVFDEWGPGLAACVFGIESDYGNGELPGKLDRMNYQDVQDEFTKWYISKFRNKFRNSSSSSRYENEFNMFMEKYGPDLVNCLYEIESAQFSPDWPKSLNSMDTEEVQDKFVEWYISNL